MKIAVLISGSGRTLQNLIKKFDIRLVFSDREAEGLKYADEAKIPWHITKDDDLIYNLCRQDKIDYICLAGYLKFLSIPNDFENRVVNIHPSLLPAFGGKGMYGHKVHEAVCQSGVNFTGCTVHFVDNEYDHGPIILQEIVPVSRYDTPDTLATKVFEREKMIYPLVLRWLETNRIKVKDKKIVLEG